MISNNKDDNVFRFIHLRGAVRRRDGDSPSDHAGARREGHDNPPEEAGGGDDVGRASKSLAAKEHSRVHRPPVSAKITGARLLTAKAELEGLKPGVHFSIPDESSDNHAAFLRLTTTGVNRLSETSRRVIEETAPGSDLTAFRLTELIDIVNDAIATDGVFERPKPFSPPDPADIPAIKSVGVAELLVVKQQILRYEAGEIAHIENVLSEEKKVRTHRRLDRIEEVFLRETETTRSQENELQITDRFELNRETTETIERDRRRGYGLSLSGRYGPSVEFSANLEIQNANSQSSTQTNAVNYARDIIERAKNTLVERVREQQRTTLIRETEEQNEHTLQGGLEKPTRGIYQFVDKIYKSQVFNYGLRQMFDFMVPEPASYLWHLERVPNPDVELPLPPIRLDAFASDAADINEGNYLELGALYDVDGLVPPPPFFRVIRISVTHGTGEASEEGKPRSFEETDIEIPDGYVPLVAQLTSVLTSDETPTLLIGIGLNLVVLQKADMTEVGLSQGNFKAHTKTNLFVALDTQTGDTVSEKLPLHVFANETANYTVKSMVTFIRKEAAMKAWRLKTYEKIAEGYRNAMLQYQQQVDELEAKRAQAQIEEETFGSPPAKNLRVIRNELKKHCLTILRRATAEALSTTHVAGDTAEEPPDFGIAEAMEDGSAIRFFESAFEWDQLQYVVYPYFWARRAEWAARFQIRNMDPTLEEFLKAGSARVVLPVRPGYEAAICFFLETGGLWNGEGEPTVKDPLYRPIVEEIRERTGAGKGEIPVGEAWETRLPTAAAFVRDDETLPEWEKVPGTDWEWKPKDTV